MRERDIHKALVERVKLLGGEVRRLSWIGRSHAPDVLVLLPGRHVFVEEKRPGEVPRPGQVREHYRLIRAGCPVRVVSSLEDIEAWLPLP